MAARSRRPATIPQEGPAAPHGVYKCRPLDGDDDRWVAISVGTGPEWRRFVVAIGSPEWATGDALGDQPSIDARAIDRVVAAATAEPCRPRRPTAGAPAIPCCSSDALFGAWPPLRGDAGARGLLAGAAVRLVDCGGFGADPDIDTPDQLPLSEGGSTPGSRAAVGRRVPSARRSPRP